MKYKTKELLKMDYPDLVKICNENCETSKCPFKPSLRKVREDGFCVAHTYRFLDGWIEEDEYTISELLYQIKTIKERINIYKKYKKIFEKEINNE